MEKQIIEIAAYFGIAPNDTESMQSAYHNGNFAGSFKQKVDTLAAKMNVEFCPFLEFIKG